MARIRVKKIESLIREEAAAFFMNEMTDPRLGFITVTQVECTSDLSRARVFVSVLGTDAQQRTCMRALEKAQKPLRGRIGGVLGIRRVPEVEILQDTGVQKSMEINELIREARAGDADQVPGAAPSASADEEE